MSRDRTKALTRLSIATLIGVGITAVGVTTAAVATPISSATVLSGTIGGPGAAINVAHPSGGVVASISAHDGDSVKAGDVLFRLEDSGLTKRVKALKLQRLAVDARIARLQAETDGRSTVTLSTAAQAGFSHAEVKAAIAAEQTQLDLDQRSNGSDVAQLQSQQRSAADALAALRSQRADLARQLVVARRAVAAPAASVVAPTATPSPAATASAAAPASATASSLSARIGSVDQEIASQRSTIEQLRERASKLGLSGQANAAGDLAGARSDRASLVIDIEQAEHDIASLAVRAPSDGTITNSQLHVAGELVGSGAPVMQLVAEQRTVTLSARLPVSDRSQVSVGQEVRIEPTSSNRLQHPTLDGTVRSISATPQQTSSKSAATYSVLVEAEAKDVRELPASSSLATGESAQLFLDGGRRTVLEYLVSPLVDRAELTFREH